MHHKSLSLGYDFKTDTISDTNVIERAGLALMRMAAKATRPIDYTGLTYLNRIVATVFPSRKLVSVRLADDTVFQFIYGDGYWGRLLDNKRTYSAAEENFLLAINDIDYAYIDCGANFGYMSALVTSKKYGMKPSYAIEADPETFQMLLQNWEQNGKRFDVTHNAVFSKSGELITMGEGKHEARAIQFDGHNNNSGKVETLKLDDLAGWIDEKNCAKLILKLDVEGVEIEALRGSKSLLKRDPLIMFEDHGNDPSHEVTTYLRNELGMRIFASEERGCRELTDPGQMTALKKNKRVGYDFLAAKGDYWPDTILSLKYPEGLRR